ncbi:MAG: bifunctional adenosylcobinamide kinase/adenosylcobinamide-phosphate guanylyltransferase [Lachnospiraceae bacterium]|nr:bifunctional adenosylcobinamide kinase/adenosylcobinamide-phosphate guanylyltransferase [Lachnospiraceae bacterium]
MKLVLGGYAQGKLDYVLQKYGREACQIYDGEIPEHTEEQGKTVVMNHFHNWVKERMKNGGCPEKEIQLFLNRCQDCVVISDEIGNGIVPMEAFEREYRERTGRILVELAKQAEEVERVICGIGQRIK